MPHVDKNNYIMMGLPIQYHVRDPSCFVYSQYVGKMSLKKVTALKISKAVGFSCTLECNSVWENFPHSVPLQQEWGNF